MIFGWVALWEVAYAIFFTDASRRRKIKRNKQIINASIKKDVAFIVDKNITNESIIKVIKNKGGKLLTNITLFDVYDMSDKKSLAYTLTFSSSERTLTVEEVMELFEKIMNEVKEKCKAIVRDN